MRRSSLRRLVLLLVACLLLLVVGFFYWVLRARSLDASALPPFVALVGEEVRTLRPVRIVRSVPATRIERSYRLLSNPQQALFEGEPEAIDVPAGTSVRMDSVRLRRGGVSGVTLPLLLGTLAVRGQSYPFEYIWGETVLLNPDGSTASGPNLRLRFPLAPWQAAADPAIYSFPEP